jgi:acetyl-CoA carboxylase biotin carboxylase subunit
VFKRVFIANRGDAAVRVARACDALGIVPVFAVSEADAGAAYVAGREHVVLGPPRAAQSYLDHGRVVQAAKQSGCTALHPGWGFLAEDARLALLCAQHGVTFVGPPPQVLQLMGKKTPAKRAMARAGLALIPGSDGLLRDAAHARQVAEQVGFPVLLKAESGGGGRGMRVAHSADAVERAFEDAQAEALAAFGDAGLYLEKLVEGGRHVEIQLLADKHGDVVHLGERDCTVQRSQQKLIEESPSPVLSDTERARTFAAAVRATRDIGYVGAGTMEFLLDRGTLRFIEMNARLQVEHGVSELRSGRDLVKEQLRVAAGHRLSFTQAEVVLGGHVLECRVNAEDPSDGFRPAPGTLMAFALPDLEGGQVRVDTHVSAGYEVSPFYDSLLCKVIVRGATREDACERMSRALRGLVCEGVPTTIPMHLAVLASAAFRKSEHTTRAIPGWPPGDVR